MNFEFLSWQKDMSTDPALEFEDEEEQKELDFDEDEYEYERYVEEQMNKED